MAAFSFSQSHQALWAGNWQPRLLDAWSTSPQQLADRYLGGRRESGYCEPSQVSRMGLHQSRCISDPLARAPRGSSFCQGRMLLSSVLAKKEMLSRSCNTTQVEAGRVVNFSLMKMATLPAATLPILHLGSVMVHKMSGHLQLFSDEQGRRLLSIRA